MSHMKRLVLIATGIALLIPSVAFAHREDYADETLVFLTLHRHELEPEYWLDVGQTAGSGYARHSIALEYGLTEHWMIDTRVSWLRPEHSGLAFDSGRLESRYRFYEEGTLPVDLAVSAELNNERGETGREWGFEPRLILSRDFAKMNATVNLADEIGLDSRETSFDPSVGFRYDATDHVRVGAEMRYFGSIGGGAIVPQVAFNLPHEVTIRLAFSYGFGNNDTSFGRAAAEGEVGE